MPFIDFSHLSSVLAITLWMGGCLYPWN